MKKGFRAEQGLSLVELLISTAIGMIVIAAGARLYVDARLNSQIQSDLEGIQQNARFAIDLLSRDIRRAGYLAGNINRRSIGGTAARIPDGTCPTASGAWGAMVQRPIFGLDDQSGSYVCITDDDYLRGDVLTLRYAASMPFGQTPSPDELLIRSSPTEAAVFTGKSESDPDNAVHGSPVLLRKLVSHAYYIRPSGIMVCPDGSRPPSLYREQLDRNGRPVAEELATGIEQLQVMFGVGINADGSTGRFIDASAMSEADWERVQRVRFWILARQECAHGHFHDPHESYVMGNMTYHTPAAERGLRRMLFARTISVRNR
ncbi:MAG: PilW family protein [Chromatiales bacterium]